MKVIIASNDRYLTDNLRRLVKAQGLFAICTNKLDRVFNELKAVGRLIIVDVNWEEIQERGVLRRIVNIARISANSVVCICPNQDEKLKKLAKAVQPEKVFIRYDIEGAFSEYLEEISLSKR